MKGRFFLLLLTINLVIFASCRTGKQATTGNAVIVGKHWKLVELDGKTVQPAEQMNKEAHLILNASEQRVNGNGGCNSFFGSYDLQGNNVITFSKIGATKMACPNNVMQVEHQFFQALEMTTQFTQKNDTLLLMKRDMSALAKFVVSNSQ